MPKKARRRSQICVGSVVVLKSGSLPMTVSHLDGGKIWADYWDGEKIQRYIGEAGMFNVTDKTISVQGALKLVTQRRV